MSSSTVFLIDDDEGARKALYGAIAQREYSVFSFASGKDFFSNYKGQRPACIVTDQRMPEMTGIQIVERLQSEKLSIPVLLITGYPNTRSTVKALQNGALTLLEKPIGIKELCNEIDKAIEVDLKTCAREAEIKRAVDKVESLTESEFRVAGLLVEGLANKAVAARLDVSLRTAEGRRASIFRKLEVDSIVGMLRVWRTANPDDQ